MPPYRPDPDHPLPPLFSGETALAHVQSLVDLGPRPAGSPALERSRRYLEQQLHALGWETRRDTFTAPTPVGDIEFVNLRARLTGITWEDPIQVLVGSHYDTKYLENIRFVGANDGGSSTGSLVELARVAATRPDFARRLELIFFDGEEAFESYTPTDGLYGSRHHARQVIRRTPAADRPGAVVILDMVGDRNLHIKIPSDTPKALADALFSAARELGHESRFGRWSTPITDDHVPFRQEGIAAIDLIDLDYNPWHTSGDTMDQISASSLEIVGQTTLQFLEKLLLIAP